MIAWDYLDDSAAYDPVTVAPRSGVLRSAGAGTDGSAELPLAQASVLFNPAFVGVDLSALRRASFAESSSAPPAQRSQSRIRPRRAPRARLEGSTNRRLRT
jgi:hypothetical protein